MNFQTQANATGQVERQDGCRLRGGNWRELNGQEFRGDASGRAHAGLGLGLKFLTPLIERGNRNAFVLAELGDGLMDLFEAFKPLDPHLGTV